MNTTFRMFPDSSAAEGAKHGEKPEKQKLSPEAVAMLPIIRGLLFEVKKAQFFVTGEHDHVTLSLNTRFNSGCYIREPEGKSILGE